MKKRVISMLLTGVMVLGLLTGCGSETAKESSAPAGSKESSAAESKTETSEETVVVKWLVPGDKQAEHDKVMEDVNKKIKEKINVELDLEWIPQGEFNDKVKLASTAGEDFDLVFTSNWLNSFDQNMSRDAFLPITSLLDEYGQGIKDSIPDWLLDVSKVDGEIYAVPNQQIIARQLGVMVQKEYADKYGLTMTSLKDVRELEPFMDEIVANEPTLFAIDPRVEAVNEREHEDFANYAAYISKTDADGKVIPITEVFEEQLRLDNEWYQKGYIRPDIVTVTDNSADVKANRYVISMSSWKPGIGAEWTSRQGVDYIDIPIEGAYVKATSGIETMTAVNVNSKNPEAAMKLLNLVYTDKEIFNELLFGLEDVHYKKTGENSAEVIPDSGYNISSYAWKLGNQFNAWTLPGQPDDVWELTDKLNREATVSPLRGFVFNPENVQAEIAQFEAVKKEFKNSQYTTTDIDQYIADYTAKLEQAGLQTIVDEVQRQIDEWKAAQ